MDGILRTFDLFMAYSPGYFVVDIVARDLAGHNDTAVIGIYILRDDQRVKIVINEIPDRVRGFEEEFIRLLSNITGAIVNTDDVQVPRGTRSGPRGSGARSGAGTGAEQCREIRVWERDQPFLSYLSMVRPGLWACFLLYKNGANHSVWPSAAQWSALSLILGEHSAVLGFWQGRAGGAARRGLPLPCLAPATPPMMPFSPSSTWTRRVG